MRKWLSLLMIFIGAILLGIGIKNQVYISIIAGSLFTVLGFIGWIKGTFKDTNQ